MRNQSRRFSQRNRGEIETLSIRQLNICGLISVETALQNVVEFGPLRIGNRRAQRYQLPVSINDSKCGDIARLGKLIQRALPLVLRPLADDRRQQGRRFVQSLVLRG